MSIVLTQAATRVRKGVSPNYSDGQEASIAINEHGSIITSQGLPPMAELVRQGNSWYGKSATTTTCLGQAVPTTTAQALIWNGEASGGKSYVIQSLGFWTDVSAGAASLFQLYAMPSIAAITVNPATTETAVIRPLRIGKGTYGGNAAFSRTVTVTDNGWLPIGQTFNSAALTATLGLAQMVEVNGLFIIPPGHTLSLAISSTNTTAEAGFIVVWHEVQMNLP